MNQNSSPGVGGWLIGIALSIGLLLFAHAGVAFLATMLLAAAWCVKVDREEYAVQVLDSDVLALNR